MDMERWSIVNAEIMTPERVISGGFVTMENGRITAVDAGAPADPGRVADAQGALLCPGLIDIHIHGSGGHWGFLGAKDLLDMARFLARFGVTAFCPTTVSLPHAAVMDSIKGVRQAMDQQDAGADYAAVPAAPPRTGARILGINVEGPYINKAMRGAHIAGAIRNPDETQIREIIETAGAALRIVTLAPELPGGLDAVRAFSAAGAVVSVGHSDATAEQTAEAARCGARLATHLFNQHRAFHHREQGAAFAMLQNPDYFCELICDGIHVHPDVARMATRLCPASELVLITDAINAAGLGPGKYQVWGFNMEVKNGAARLEDGTLAGSVLTLNRAVANMAQFSGLPLHQAAGMATHNPAQLLGLLPHAGVIAPGAAADLALFDKNMDCLATVIAGHPAHRADNSPL